MSDATIWDPGLTGPPGPPGARLLIRKTSTHLQYAYEGTEIWTNLVSLDEITGPQGEAIVGPQGPQGIPGESIVGPVGPEGPQGEASVIYSAAGTPAGGLGNNGDYYINLTNGDFYGPKAAGSWGSPVSNIIGPAGPPGGFLEAPTDGKYYARKDLAWVDVALNFLAKTGGQIAAYNEKLQSVAAADLNLAVANVFQKILSANITFTMSGATSGQVHPFTLEVEGGNTYSVTWPVSFRWMNTAGAAIPPILSSKHVISGYTIDGGANWRVWDNGSYV